MISLSFYEGYTCPTCQRAFSENDDVVYCPQCGLPHHRACWMSEGHCHLAHLHNTEEQWSRDKKKAPVQPEANPTAEPAQNESRGYSACPHCGTQNPEFAEFCQHCGSSLDNQRSWQSEPQPNASYGEYQPFRHSETPNSNAIPGEEVDGIKMEDLAAVIGSKADYYLPRFRRMSRSGGNASWNWAAFFLSPLWLFYRKMYGLGVVVMILDIIQAVVTAVGYKAIGLTGNEVDFTELMALIQASMDNPSDVYVLFALWLMSLVTLIVSIAIGIYANRLYLTHCQKTIRRARSRTPDLTAGELTSIGGTSTAIAVIAYFAQFFITEIISIFI